MKNIGRLVLLSILIFGAARARAAASELTVAADGSGQFKTVQAAIDAVPQTASADQPCVIRVKAGVYRELVYVQREKRFVRLVGESRENTVISFDLYAGLAGPDGRPIGTFHTPTVQIDADNFTAENITFENTNEARGGASDQALALLVTGDRVVFRHCGILGWHHTMLVDRGRHYFEGCRITGNMNFIFGGATDYFADCELHCTGDGCITDASTPADQPYGFVFNHCRITGEYAGIRTWLGRPWRAEANVVFLRTEMSGVVRPEGWNNADQPEREKTARFAEFGNSGPGANVTARVPWTRPLTAPEAKALTVVQVLGGTDGWDPREDTLP